MFKCVDICSFVVIVFVDCLIIFFKKQAKQHAISAQIHSVDSEYKKKMAPLEQANTVSANSYELKETVASILAELHALDALILDGAGVGKGAHTEALWQSRKQKEEVCVCVSVCILFVCVVSCVCLVP